MQYSLAETISVCTYLVYTVQLKIIWLVKPVLLAPEGPDAIWHYTFEISWKLLGSAKLACLWNENLKYGGRTQINLWECWSGLFVVITTSPHTVDYSLLKTLQGIVHLIKYFIQSLFNLPPFRFYSVGRCRDWTHAGLCVATLTFGSQTLKPLG
jgi:hypothetical protein